MVGWTWRLEDRAVFGALLEEHRPAVSRLCTRMVWSADRAEELVQDAFLVAFRERHRFDRTGSLRGWVLGIARLLCKNAIRKRREAAADDGRCLVDEGESPLDVVTRRQRAEALAEALGALTADQRRAVYLRYWEGRSNREIVRRLELHQESGARGVLQTARRKLKDRLQDLELD